MTKHNTFFTVKELIAWVVLSSLGIVLLLYIGQPPYISCTFLVLGILGWILDRVFTPAFAKKCDDRDLLDRTLDGDAD